MRYCHLPMGFVRLGFGRSLRTELCLCLIYWVVPPLEMIGTSPSITKRLVATLS